MVRVGPLLFRHDFQLVIIVLIDKTLDERRGEESRRLFCGCPNWKMCDVDGIGTDGSVRDRAGNGRRSKDMENPRGSDGLHQSRAEGDSYGIPRRRSLATCRQGGGRVTERFSRHLARGWQPFLEHGLHERSCDLRANFRKTRGALLGCNIGVSTCSALPGHPWETMGDNARQVKRPGLSQLGPVGSTGLRWRVEKRVRRITNSSDALG